MEQLPPIDEPSENDTEDPSNNLLGCGLASYASILAFIFLVGVAGIVGSTWSLLNSPQNTYAGLTEGSEVRVWQLAPLRQAGVIEMLEVPAAWHDESVRLDATSACAMMDDRIVKVENQQGHTLYYTEMESIQGVETDNGGYTVTAVGSDTSIVCRFRYDEGGPRLYRQLLTEQGKAQAHRVPTAPNPTETAPTVP